MMRKVIKQILALIISLITLSGVVGFAVCAADTPYVPYESYTYWEEISGEGRKIVKNKPMYTATKTVTARDLGVSEFTELADVCSDKDGNLYLLDSAFRIVVTDKEYHFVKEIKAINKDPQSDFSAASGIYVHSDQSMYISDSGNKRVVHCDENGTYIDEYRLPDSPLIPPNFDFQPTAVTADEKGYVYILCQGSYYGALLYAPDKSFIGFYGTNTVTNSILDALQSLLQRLFPNNEKKKNSEKALPYSFNDLIIDEKGFIYTVTDSSKMAQIKKLNPGFGNNILESEEVNFADDEVNTTYLDKDKEMEQHIIGAAVDQDGFIYALDSAFGRVYLFDSDCRMITAFAGGMGVGKQVGTFAMPVAVALSGDDVVVGDKANNAVTVFECNDYGKRVKTLIALTLKGDYDQTKTGWQQVLKEDKNLQVAYNGLARAYLDEKDYKQAMKVSLEGYDRETYALAYKNLRKIWLSDHFGLLFGGIVLMIGLVGAGIVFSMKKKKRLIRNKELALVLDAPFHPNISFETVKEKHSGSLKISGVLLLIFYLVTVAKETLGGFLFTDYDPAEFNSLWVFVQSIGLVVLWIVSNMLVSQLLDGKGSTKEIIIVSSYSLIPIILERIVWTVLTNFLLPEEAAFLNILTTFALIWAGIMLISGMITVHEYSFGKFLGTTVLTVLGMAAIVFILLLVGILIQQLGGFFITVLTEFLYLFK